jgi:large subunit ribosomal protein L10
MLDAAKVDALSKIPGKDQLRSMFLATLKEPAASLARVLKAKADKEGGDEAPAADAPAAEAPAEA